MNRKKESWLIKIYHHLFPKLKREIFIKVDGYHYIYKRFYTNHTYSKLYCFTQTGILWRNTENMEIFCYKLCNALETFYVECGFNEFNYIEKENDKFTVKAVLTDEQLQTHINKDNV